MRYVMKQKMWAWGNDFTIKNEAGQDCFFVDGQAMSIGDKLSIRDMAKNELAFIRQKLLSWGPTYEIYHGGQLFAIVKEELFTFLNYRFQVDVGADGPTPNDLEIQGDFFAHEYAFMQGGRQVAAVSKQWFAWTDTFGVDVQAGEDDVLILACTVVVDRVVQKSKNEH